MDYHQLSCEKVLEAALSRAADEQCPPRLAEALWYSVFPGGARVRPQLCLAVAGANLGSDPMLASSAGAAIELLHCASLVHDDLPCFDNADERRGKQSVHTKFDERIAVLTGDALIVSAFDTLAWAGSMAKFPERLASVTTIVARSVGAPLGIAAGQAWESEPEVDVSLYHKSKTGALFIAASAAGAASAGADPAPWQLLGEKIGEAYQVADDIKDATGDSEILGKPVHVDETLNRPSAVRELGLQGATEYLKRLLEEGLDSIPSCPGRDGLQNLVREQARRFIPKDGDRQAA